MPHRVNHRKQSVSAVGVYILPETRFLNTNIKKFNNFANLLNPLLVIRAAFIVSNEL